MPLHYNIDPKERLVRIVGTGVVSMSSTIAEVERVAADPRFEPRFMVIFDLREVHYEAELKDGDELAAVLRQKKSDFQNKFAVVVPGSLLLLVKLYCLLANMAGFEKIMPFTDMEEAEKWCSAQA